MPPQGLPRVLLGLVFTSFYEVVFPTKEQAAIQYNHGERSIGDEEPTTLDGVYNDDYHNTIFYELYDNDNGINQKREIYRTRTRRMKDYISKKRQ